MEKEQNRNPGNHRNQENHRATGTYYEKEAANYLEEQGYEILTMNYRCRLGEIDIIAKDEEYLVFVEVKYRKSGAGGSPEEAVNYKKQHTISRVASYYLMKEYGMMDVCCRFDVVAILDGEIRLIRNAFEYR